MTTLTKPSTAPTPTHPSTCLCFKLFIYSISLVFTTALVTQQYITPPLVASALRDTGIRDGLDGISSYLAELLESPSLHAIKDNLMATRAAQLLSTSFTTNFANTSTNYEAEPPAQRADDVVTHIQAASQPPEQILPHPDIRLPQDQEQNHLPTTRIEDAELREEQPLAVQPEVSVPATGSNETVSDVLNKLSNTTTNGWYLPPNMTMYETVRRGTAFDREMTEHSWMQPRALLAYSRTTGRGDIELFVYSTGVTMGNFDVRNLSVWGCVVGGDVYPLKFGVTDIFLCKLPRGRELLSGESVSLAILRDENLERALRFPIELTPGLSLNLTLGADVFPMHQNVTVHSSEAGGGLSREISGNDLVRVTSNVTAVNSTAFEGNWVLGTETQQPRYEVCGVTMMKQFPHLLDPWIDYHHRLGVDRMYILDNAATDDLGAKYAGRADVEVVYWPFQRTQVQGMSLFAVASRSRCEWLLSFDADEYVMVGIGPKGELAGERVLKKLLSASRKAGYDDIRFRYVTMGPSAQVYIPSLPPPEAYVHKWSRQKVNSKSASLTEREWIFSKIHYQKGRFSERTREVSGSTNDRPETPDDEPALVHFQFRSLEEAILKKKFGSSSISDHNIDNGTATDGRSLDNPSKEYLRTNDSLRYTFFRDMWRAVTNTTSINSHTLVLYRGAARCTVEYAYREHTFRNEQCVVEKEGK